MDVLTRLAGSQLPNAFALVAAVLLTIVAFAMRYRAAGVGYALMTLAFGAAVGIKNAMYSAVISGPHHENDLAARHDYARVLLFVAVAQTGLAVVLGLITASAQRLRWLAVLVLLAFGFAADCMQDWRLVYLHQSVGQPVRFQVSAPWFHWLLLVGMVPAAVMALVSLARRSRPQAQH